MAQPTEALPFPDMFRRFRSTIGDHAFRGLVLVGTLQADTPSLLIAGLNPERIAFLLTDQSREKGLIAQCRARLEQVADQVSLRCSPDAWFCPNGDHSNVLSVYTGLRAVLDRWNDLEHHEIAVDLTGGKATMTVGLAKAAHVLRLASVYVDSDYADNRPIPGTQRLATPEDPYLVFGDLEAAEACRLHNHHDYAGAERVFRDLARRVPDNQDYAIYADLSAAYLAWDSFVPQPAAMALDRVLAHNVLPDALQARRVTLEAQRQALTQLTAINQCLTNRHSQAADALAALNDLDQVLALLGSLHGAALRRAAQERYDVAALMRYRCLELLSQHRLATYSVWTAEPSFDAAHRRVPDLNGRYRQVQREQGFRKVYDLPERSIALFEGYMLLQALDDPLVREWDIGLVRQRSYVRNTSILAHGFRAISRHEYEQFADIVENVLDRFFTIAQLPRYEWEQTYHFVTLDV
ncbi:MAG: TIGR02710 family CRISPR-associated protein [Roseiflexus castenholzii]|uniref:TIGR02710 family CRISPR-associated CARF protein n=1 Tax=Roseiflexus castenholzii TaxID=120962 RepID=UPI000CAB54E9|nr:MAG: TIGR02710 family CRISPR-associated protein [Roseiflexus castenholzii]